MDHVIIDEEKCTGCGLCTKDCFVNVLYIENGKAKTKASGCAECGHCYALCPAGAISMPGYETDEKDFDDAKADAEPKGFGDAEPEGFDDAGFEDFGDSGFEGFDDDVVLRAMKSRRSVRHFTDEPVTDDEIMKIIEAGRYSPTAVNAQNVRFTVITGSKMAEFEHAAVAFLRKSMKLAAPFSSSAKSTHIGDDFLFKGAPAAILVTAEKGAVNTMFADVNGSIAAAYMEIIAESMGLGVLYSGFTVFAARFSPKARKIAGIRMKEKPVICVVIGHPDPAFRYRRVPPRKAALIKKLD